MRLARLTVSCLVSLASCAGCGEQPPPDPGDPAVVERRSEAVASAERELDVVGAALGAEVVGRASTDVCYEGQQNWKLDEGYAYRCTVRRARALSFGGDFRWRIRRLDARLRASGWEAGRTLSDEIVEWWEFRVAQTPNEPFRISELATGGPYYRTSDLQLSFAYAGADPYGTRALASSHEPLVAVQRTHEDARPFDVQAVLEQAADDAYVVVAAVDVHYLKR